MTVPPGMIGLDEACAELRDALTIDIGNAPGFSGPLGQAYERALRDAHDRTAIGSAATVERARAAYEASDEFEYDRAAYAEWQAPREGRDFQHEAAVLISRAISAGSLDVHTEHGRVKTRDWTSASIDHCRSIVAGRWLHVVAHNEPAALHVDAKLWRVWLETETRRRTVAAESACQRWLEQEMRKAPERSSRTYTSWSAEAISRFGTGRNAFRRAWSAAIEATGAKWNTAGRPPKNPPT